ncbi:DUF2262 domain-containing protein [Myroides pelagicus]|uniref:DUF2262 domain-containing protein n=1 Tax=Myroides pelagicus TaxID=270914 RepID=UPI002DB7EFA6|nr:DUF2262 domain-containing protein [Myroides pelagicus]MEC4113552.1 DUF2262 domain-containing protein [Myroides pelagicus]
MKVGIDDFRGSEYDEDILEMDYCFGQQEINICMYCSVEMTEELLSEVNQLLVKLEQYDSQAKKYIAEELYEAYSQEVEGLSEQQFLSDLTLLSLYFTGNQSVEFSYEGGEYFGDHILSIEMIEGKFDRYVAMNG